MFRLLFCAALLPFPVWSQQSAPTSAPDEAAKLDGTIRGANTQPLSKVRLTLRPGATAAGQAAASPLMVSSDSDGKFAFDNIRAGQYVLTAVMDGYETTVYRTAAGFTTFPIAAGQHMSGIKLQMVPMSILTGEVRDEDDKPMAGLVIRPLRKQLLNGVLQAATAGAGVRTGEDGRFRLPVATGRWYLSYSAERPKAPSKSEGADQLERSYVKEYYPGVTHAGEALAINVSGGEERPGLDVKLRKVPVFHIRGKVGGMAGGGLGLQITETGGDFSESLFNEPVLVSDQGTFDAGGLPAGSWTLTVAGAKGNPVSLAQQVVQVGDRNIDGVLLGAHRPVQIAGSVKIVPEPDPNAPASTPAPRMTVRITPLDSPMGAISAVVQGDQSFVLQDAGARRYLVSLAPPPGGYVKSITCRGVDALNASVDLTESGEGARLDIVVSMTSGEVDGSIRVDSGTAPPATVSLIPVPPQPQAGVYRPDLRRAVPSNSGQFAFTNVAPGTYRIYAWERMDPNLLLEPEMIQLFDSLSVTVTLGDKERQVVTAPLIPADRMDGELKRHVRE